MHGSKELQGHDKKNMNSEYATSAAVSYMLGRE